MFFSKTRRKFGAAFLLAAFLFGGVFNANAQNSAARAANFETASADASAAKTNFAPHAGELDASPNINIDTYPGTARATVAQTDGKILVAGNFRTVNGARRKSIARLNADFSLDATFSADVNGTINAVAVQSDGKIIIGGAFLSIGNASRNRIARLNADGSLDATFNPGTGADNAVLDVVVQTDGKILIGGDFSAVNSTNRNDIARLNADGSVDTGFVSPISTPAPSPNFFFFTSVVNSIALQANGKIVIGGFIVVGSDGSTLLTKSVARLNANGAFDNSFDVGNINANVAQVIAQPDGKILAAGAFTQINGVNRNYIVRFNTDGSLDESFNIGTGPNRFVNRIFLQTDGKILLAGSFSAINGTARGQLARLNADGSLDAGFAPNSGLLLGLGGTVQSLFALPNGKIIVGGSFAGGFNFGGSDAVKVFNADGSIDSSVRFDATALGGVRAIAVQTDGKIIVGGNFTRPRSGAVAQLFRLKTDGTLDETFAASSGGVSFGSSFTSQVNSIVIQPDGKIIVGGSNIVVTSGTGLARITGLARLNADGTTDDSFVLASGSLVGGVNHVAVQPDGKILAVSGGTQPNGFSSGGIVRLNGDGSVDSSFSTVAVPPAAFYSVNVQTDGKIIVGGDFSFSFVNSQTGTISYNGIVRLNADGTRDTTFVPATTTNAANNQMTRVFAVALQTDGKILIGGSIFNGGATAPTGAARLNADGSLDATFNAGAIASSGETARVEDIFPLPNGKVLIGGLFERIAGTVKNNIARLNADGSLDNAFNASADNAVYDIAVQTDGKVLIGGDFETVNGAIRTSLARLLSEPLARRTRFDFDGDGKADVSAFRPANGAWYLQNSASGFAAAQFGAANDKIVPADYDADGRTDLAVYRAGTWYLNRSAQGFVGIAFGNADDVPQPADFDGDGRSELAVFRPSNGFWYVYNLTTNQTTAVQFGQSGDKPVAADYDADGKADFAVFRPSNGTWYLNRTQAGFTVISFGASTDKLVPADYDGDGKTDVAVFRLANGTWYLLQSSAGFAGIAFGAATDLPTPADYDGDAKADVGVFRPSNGTWYVQRSQLGLTGISFGASEDKPIPNAFIQ